MTFESQGAFVPPAEDQPTGEPVAPAAQNTVSEDPKLEKMFGQPRKYTVDGNGMVHFVDTEAEAGEVHQKLHEDA